MAATLVASTGGLGHPEKRRAQQVLQVRSRRWNLLNVLDSHHVLNRCCGGYLNRHRPAPMSRPGPSGILFEVVAVAAVRALIAAATWFLIARR